MIIRWRRMLKRWLPGIISGGADNDPAGISTYSIAGAQFGYQQLWLLVLSTPMLISVQAMCARLGDVKRKGLMTIMKEHYAPIFQITALVILVLTNIATLGADLAAMADAFGLVTQTPFRWWVIPVSITVWYIVVFKNYKTIERYLFFLTFVFLAYVISGILVRPDWMEVVRAIFLPRIELSARYFIVGLGLLGTTITPFLFFWQSKQEVEEHSGHTALQQEAKREDTHVAPGFIYSNVISLFIMIATAGVLHAHGVTDIVDASGAARALEPFVGPFAKYLFAIGIIGSGLLAIPVLAASTAYVVAESFGWRDSLSDKVDEAKGFYTTLTASFLVGAGIAISGIQPMVALLYSQVFNGILAPVLIVLILFMCNDRKIMGNYVNTWFDNLFGWVTVLVMMLGTSGLFWQLLKG